jgi:hypothetical protein
VADGNQGKTKKWTEKQKEAHAWPRSRPQKRPAEKETISKESSAKATGQTGSRAGAMGSLGFVAARSAKVAARIETDVAEAES